MKTAESAQFNDRRLVNRLGWLRARVETRPGVGFPQMVETESDLEAIYRFLRNPRVTAEAIRAVDGNDVRLKTDLESEILVVHDTTEFSFGGQSQRTGLGRLRSSAQGFQGHFSLALSAEGSRRPLGVLAIQNLFQLGPPKRLRGRNSREDPSRRTLKWLKGVALSKATLSPTTSAIHLMDREADAFEVIAGMCAADRFVVRIRSNRLVLEDGSSLNLLEALSGMSAVLKRDVPLSERRPKPGNVKHQHPTRPERTATLHFRARTLKFPRPQYGDKDLPALIDVNVVHVFEPSPPTGEEPIEWLLCTTEPIDTVAQVAKVVDWYRARWVIEEFFKAIKTGCAYEKRQLESAHALVNALAVIAPVAVQLLALRSAARLEPTAPAGTAVTPLQLKILGAIQRRYPLPENPSARDALLAVAALGGHLKNNGEPGWQTLWRGWERLLLSEQAWSAALAS